MCYALHHLRLGQQYLNYTRNEIKKKNIHFGFRFQFGFFGFLQMFFGQEVFELGTFQLHTPAHLTKNTTHNNMSVRETQHWCQDRSQHTTTCQSGKHSKRNTQQHVSETQHWCQDRSLSELRQQKYGCTVMKQRMNQLTDESINGLFVSL